MLREINRVDKHIDTWPVCALLPARAHAAAAPEPEELLAAVRAAGVVSSSVLAQRGRGQHMSARMGIAMPPREEQSFGQRGDAGFSGVAGVRRTHCSAGAGEGG
jgi:hypothetical protein